MSSSTKLMPREDLGALQDKRIYKDGIVCVQRGDTYCKCKCKCLRDWLKEGDYLTVQRNTGDGPDDYTHCHIRVPNYGASHWDNGWLNAIRDDDLFMIQYEDPSDPFDPDHEEKGKVNGATFKSFFEELEVGYWSVDGGITEINSEKIKAHEVDQLMYVRSKLKGGVQPIDSDQYCQHSWFEGPMAIEYLDGNDDEITWGLQEVLKHGVELEGSNTPPSTVSRPIVVNAGETLRVRLHFPWDGTYKLKQGSQQGMPLGTIVFMSGRTNEEHQFLLNGKGHGLQNSRCRGIDSMAFLDVKHDAMDGAVFPDPGNKKDGHMDLWIEVVRGSLRLDYIRYVQNRTDWNTDGGVIGHVPYNPRDWDTYAYQYTENAPIEFWQNQQLGGEVFRYVSGKMTMYEKFDQFCTNKHNGFDPKPIELTKEICFNIWSPNDMINLTNRKFFGKPVIGYL